MSSEKDDIERYRQGTLDGAKRNALEKKALHDPFLADALEGAESIGSEEFSSDLQELSKSIKSKRRSVYFIPLRMAAGIALLAGVGAVFYYFLQTPQTLPLALNKPADTTVSTDEKLAEGKDSTSDLLSLAKPEKTHEEKLTSPEPVTSSGRTLTSETTKTSTSPSGEQPAEKTTAVELKTEEEKAKAPISELTDDKEELLDQSAPSLSSAGASNQKKEESAKRDAKAKDSKQTLPTLQNISGTVKADNGAALPGVNVTVQGSADGAITDQNGNFQLVTQQSNPRLVFRSIGMARKDLGEKLQPPVNMRMSPDVNQRSEITVSGEGLGNQRRAQGLETLELALPEGGMDEFQRYLEANVRYPAIALSNKTEGSVTVQFTTNPDGSLVNFQIIHGIGDGCDEELVRLIQEGPKWIPTQLNKTPLEDRVSVQFRFILPRSR